MNAKTKVKLPFYYFQSTYKKVIISQDNVDCLSVLAYLTCKSMIQTGNNCKDYMTKWLFHGCLGRAQQSVKPSFVTTVSYKILLLQNVNKFTNVEKFNED